jgi:predicted negative regulator of RcsB-dependent stress response
VENDLDMGNPRWEATKAFVSRYRLTLTVAVVGLLLLVAAGLAYQNYRQDRLVSASDHYQRALAALQQGNTSRARTQLTTTAERFSATPYGGMARVLLARLHHEAGETGQARSVLQPLVDGEGEPRIARHLAVEEMARLRWEAEGPQAALQVLDKLSDRAFLPTYYLLRGDLLAEAGQPARARSAYEQARQAPGAQRLSGDIDRRLDGLPKGAEK